MIIGTDSQSSLGNHEAEKVLAVLCAAYPGHPWMVRVDQGIIFIRHLEFGNNGWGMNCHARNVDHDAAVWKKEIIMMAGEFLERAGLVRGRANGDEIIRVEGVPEKYQPHRPIELKEVTGDARDAHRQMSGLHEMIGKRDG